MQHQPDNQAWLPIGSPASVELIITVRSQHLTLLVTLQKVCCNADLTIPNDKTLPLHPDRDARRAPQLAKSPPAAGPLTNPFAQQQAAAAAPSANPFAQQKQQSQQHHLKQQQQHHRKQAQALTGQQRLLDATAEDPEEGQRASALDSALSRLGGVLDSTGLLADHALSQYEAPDDPDTGEATQSACTYSMMLQASQHHKA